MKSAETLKIKNKSEVLKGLKGLLVPLAVLVISVIFSRANILDKISVFGVSFVSSLSAGKGIFALIGCIIGYTLGSLSLNSTRYIAQAIIVLAARWTFSDFFNSDKKYRAAGLAVAVSLFTGLVYIFSIDATVYDVLLVLCESVICGGASYFMQTLTASLENREFKKTPQSVVALCVVGAIAFMSLSQIKVGFVSLGHVLAAFVLMLISQNSGSLGGSCAGLAIGTALSVSEQDGGFMVMVLGLGSMLSGLFRGSFKIISALTFVLCSVLSAVVVASRSENLYIVYEVIFAAVIFLLIPEKYTNNLLFDFCRLELKGEEYPNRYLSSRLSFIAQSISDAKQSLCEVSDKLSTQSTGEVDMVFSSAADRVCRRCGMKIDCWTHRYGDTMDSFNNMTEPLFTNGRIYPENIPDYLRQRCTKLSLLVNEINSGYNRYSLEKQRIGRCRQMKDIVTEQFDGMSNLLYEMSQELSLTMCDRESEGKVKNELVRIAMPAVDISCPVDRFGRKTVEFYSPITACDKLDLDMLTEQLSKVCKVSLNKAQVIKNGQSAKFVLTEQAPFSLEIASYQLCADNEEICGDFFETAEMQNGFSAVVLSDGMGRGKTAAVDSRMTVSLITRFLKLGFTIENCISLINSALMVKSQEESLSTLDAAVFDLYSGVVSIKKAGAPPSYIRRGRRVSKVEIGALPLGILSEAKIRKADIKLSKGDIVLLATDGMSELCDKEIENELLCFKGSNLNALCENLAKKARGDESKGNNDDITVIAVRLN